MLLTSGILQMRGETTVFSNMYLEYLKYKKNLAVSFALAKLETGKRN